MYGTVAVARDDLYGDGQNVGGKVRGARRLMSKISGKAEGVVGYAPSICNQLRIVAWTARECNLPALLVCAQPRGIPDSNITSAKEAGAELVFVEEQRLPEVTAAARRIAMERGWFLFPWGMKCRETVDCFREAVSALPGEYDHIVLACGSGASLAGIAEGLEACNSRTQLWGICIGRSSHKVARGLRSITELSYPRIKFINLGNYGTKAQMMPPFPSDPYYDARAWEKFTSLGLKGRVLFWNLGSWDHVATIQANEAQARRCS